MAGSRQARGLTSKLGKCLPTGQLPAALAPEGSAGGPFKETVISAPAVAFCPSAEFGNMQSVANGPLRKSPDMRPEVPPGTRLWAARGGVPVAAGLLCAPRCPAWPGPALPAAGQPPTRLPTPQTGFSFGTRGTGSDRSAHCVWGHCLAHSRCSGSAGLSPRRWLLMGW